jgi:hemerythrin-like domain-containing protein
MPTAPNLLNDDGSASIATTLMMSHHAFRRDVARFAIALDKLAAGDRAKITALQGEWQHYRNALHGHHEAEDTGIFPNLGSQHASLSLLIAELTADHRKIDPLLARGDRAFAELGASSEAAASVISDLSALLDPHLAKEEAHIIPHLRPAKAFPPPSNDAEVELYAQGFAWASEGIAPEVLARVDELLPASLTSKLPAAKAAFAARIANAWGPTPPGASRTPIPDWFSGAR